MLTAVAPSLNAREGSSPVRFGPWIRFKILSARGPVPVEHDKVYSPTQPFHSEARGLEGSHTEK